MPVKVDSALAESIRSSVADQRDTILSFFRELSGYSKRDGTDRDVGSRVAQEMERLHFDDIRFDRMGNVLGRVGNGPRILLYDSHLDTVDVGDRSAWKWDPFRGKIEDGIFYARGAGDEKQSTPGMIYGMALARDLGLLDGFTLYYFGNMEEDCDGIAPNVLVEVRYSTGFCGDRRTHADAGLSRPQRARRTQGGR